MFPKTSITGIKDGNREIEILLYSQAPVSIPPYYISKTYVLTPFIAPVRITEPVRNKKSEPESMATREDTMSFLLYSTESECHLIPWDDGVQPSIKDTSESYNIWSKNLPSHEHLMSSDTFDRISRILIGESKIVVLEPQQLWKDSRQFIEKHVEFSEPVHYVIYTAWVFGTYFYYAYDAYPYLHFFGPSDSGKSRALETGCALAFHGEKVDDASISALFREMKSLGYSCFLDEKEWLYSPKENPDMVQFLNSGYRKGGRIKRCNVNDPDKVENFPSYTPKAIASINDLYPVLRSRCIQMIMSRSLRHAWPAISEEEANELRQKLFMLRVIHGRVVAAEIPQTIIPEDWGLRSRESELFLPIYHMVTKFGAPDDLDTLKSFLSSYISRRRADLRNEIDTTVIPILNGKLGTNEVKFILVRDIKEQVLRNEGAYKVVGEGGREREILDANRETTKTYTDQKIGYALKRYGFEKKKKEQGNGYLIERKKLDKAAFSLGLAKEGIDGKVVFLAEEGD